MSLIRTIAEDQEVPVLDEEEEEGESKPTPKVPLTISWKCWLIPESFRRRSLMT